MRSFSYWNYREEMEKNEEELVSEREEEVKRRVKTRKRI